MNRSPWTPVGLYVGTVLVVWPPYAQLAFVTGFPVPILLPLGMCAYQLLAMWVLIESRGGRTARRLAGITAAVFALLGVLTSLIAGQVSPWGITAFVACLPVVVLGCGAALAHLLREQGDE